MNRKKLQHFFNNVTIRLGIFGWSLQFIYDSSEGYCWKSSKVIDIGLNSKDPKQLLIHEIAHIRTCRFCNQKHNFNYWKTFEDLMKKFLPDIEINNSMKLHKSFASEGFYKKSYE